MKNKINTLCAVVAIIAICISCKKTNPINIADWITWNQQHPDGVMFFAGSDHTYSFKDDSFRAKISYWDDDVILDSCAHSRTDYIRGTYQKTNDSISFNGKMCDTLYQSLIANCAGTRDYRFSYKFVQYNDSTLILNPDGAPYYLNIVLKKAR